MKQLTSYNRVAGYLNKLFDLLNQRFFESALSRPTITIQSTPRAYGHFSMRDDTWVFPFSERRKTGGLSLYPEAAANDSEREIDSYLFIRRADTASHPTFATVRKI